VKVFCTNRKISIRDEYSTVFMEMHIIAARFELLGEAETKEKETGEQPLFLSNML